MTDHTTENDAIIARVRRAQENLAALRDAAVNEDVRQAYRSAAYMVSAALEPAPTCDHEWSERGSPGDWWQECWLCGGTRDHPTSPGGCSDD